MRRLAAWVHVPDENGATHAFGPDDVVPEWAAVKITNPKAWAKTVDDVVVVESPVSLVVVSSPPVSPVPVSGGLERPPASGAGSGVEAWSAYAVGLGIVVPDGATRGDVITLVDVFDDEQKK